MNITKTLNIIRQAVKDYALPLGEAVNNEYKDPFKVLVSTILSARTRDETTARVCKELFKKNLKKLSLKEIEKIIKPVNYYKNKAKYLFELRKLKKVPSEIDELIKLPGVGRKTANLVVNVSFKKEGICVDTHVHRIMNRLGYVNTKTPKQTEFALREKLPRKHWSEINYLLVLYGQHVCTPRKPHCNECKINDCLSRKDYNN